jgi:Mrp family chromosome partitioning ATPase
MKVINDNNAAMNEPLLPPAAKVHVVKTTRADGVPEAEPAAAHMAANTSGEGSSESAAEPLRIEYSQTQIRTDALARLQRTHGVVRLDRSELSESFKMLRNQVLQRMRADGHTLLAVTSARGIEGKSLTAVNLALTIAAQYDSAVLLVDADLGGQGLQALFGLDGLRGLSDHLTDGVPISELLVNPGVARFVVLPAGKQAVLDSAELLSTKAAQQLFLEMKQRYQDRYIIVDLPPMLDTADAMAFLPQVDTTLVVVEEHTTSVQDMEAMTELLAPFNVIGTVMSKPREPTEATAPTRRPWYRRWFSRKG